MSEFGFFDGSAARPSASLIPYKLRTPLFSDYAEKQRYIYLPEGARLTAQVDGTIIFPVGSALIKSFGYAGEGEGLNIIETRVLLHQKNGWIALPYVWRADGSDADLKLGGTRIPIKFERSKQLQSISYAVPNKNQCKQCHSSDQQLVPLGTVWPNIELPRKGDRDRFEKEMPQLAKLESSAGWDDPASGTLEERAKSYLKVNCGHCHALRGSASNSGLFLDGSAIDSASVGIGKRPVAAGRASGDNDFVIEPSHPERSILIYRMKSTETGIAMPELGRATTHMEGVRLLEEWIAAMPVSVH